MLIEGEAGSIGELVQEAERIRREFKPDDNDREEIWYRGQNVASHPLTPTLYRKEAKAFHYDELTLMDRFEALAAPLVGRRPARPLEWYFLARHHKDWKVRSVEDARVGELNRTTEPATVGGSCSEIVHS